MSMLSSKNTTTRCSSDDTIINALLRSSSQLAASSVIINAIAIPEQQQQRCHNQRQKRHGRISSRSCSRRRPVKCRFGVIFKSSQSPCRTGGWESRFAIVQCHGPNRTAAIGSAVHCAVCLLPVKSGCALVGTEVQHYDTWTSTRAFIVPIFKVHEFRSGCQPRK